MKMVAKRKSFMGFELSMSAREDGTIETVYLLFSDASVTRTREIEKDALLADYDKSGELVGIEILAPVSIASLVSLLDDPSRRESLARFLEKRAPQELVRA